MEIDDQPVDLGVVFSDKPLIRDLFFGRPAPTAACARGWLTSGVDECPEGALLLDLAGP